MKQINIFENVNALYEDRRLTLKAFKNGIFSLKPSQGNRLKMLSLKKKGSKIASSICASKSW